MATKSPDLVLDVAALSARLLEIQEIAARAGIVANAVAGLLPGTAVNIYLLTATDEGDVWNVCATVGDADPDPSIPVQTGLLGVLASEMKPLLLAGKQLAREEYAHLNVRRTLESLAYLPLMASDSLIGVVEILNFELPLDEAHLHALQPVAGLAGPALQAAQAYEEGRNSSLASISRQEDMRRHSHQ